MQGRRGVDKHPFRTSTGTSSGLQVARNTLELGVSIESACITPLLWARSRARALAVHPCRCTGSASVGAGTSAPLTLI